MGVKRAIPVTLALLGALGAAIQAALLLSSGKAICLNEGCRVIEGLTRVPPLYINLAGLGFFLAAAVLALARARRRGPPGASSVCCCWRGSPPRGCSSAFSTSSRRPSAPGASRSSALVVLLNLLAGARQALRAAAVFVSSLAAFSVAELRCDPAPGRRAGARRRDVRGAPLRRPREAGLPGLLLDLPPLRRGAADAGVVQQLQFPLQPDRPDPRPRPAGGGALGLLRPGGEPRAAGAARDRRGAGAPGARPRGDVDHPRREAHPRLHPRRVLPRVAGPEHRPVAAARGRCRWSSSATRRTTAAT